MTKAERFKRLSPAAQKMYRRMQNGDHYNWEKYRDSPTMAELQRAGFVRRQMVPAVYKLEFIPKNMVVRVIERRTKEAFLDA